MTSAYQSIWTFDTSGRPASRPWQTPQSLQACSYLAPEAPPVFNGYLRKSCTRARGNRPQLPFAAADTHSACRCENASIDNGLDSGAPLAHTQAYTSVIKSDRSALPAGIPNIGIPSLSIVAFNEEADVRSRALSKSCHSNRATKSTRRRTCAALASSRATSHCRPQ